MGSKDQHNGMRLAVILAVTVIAAASIGLFCCKNRAMSVRVAKALDGPRKVKIYGTVTAVFQEGSRNRAYIESDHFGMAVITKKTQMIPGDQVVVSGELHTSLGEKVLDASAVSKTIKSKGVPGGVGIMAKDLGNKEQINGLVGTLVSVRGRVTRIESPRSFLVDARPGIGISIHVMNSGWSNPKVNSDVTITGILATDKQAIQLRPRGPIDLSYLRGCNYLCNPGFESGKLAGWDSIDSAEAPHSGTWFGGVTAHSGKWFFGNAANGGAMSGFLWQRVPASVGFRYQAQVWSCAYRAGNPIDSVQCRVGIDSAGGTDPASKSVRWSKANTQPMDYVAVWRKLTSPVVVCSADHVTVFLEATQKNIDGWHLSCFDDAFLTAVSN